MFINFRNVSIRENFINLSVFLILIAFAGNFGWAGAEYSEKPSAPDATKNPQKKQIPSLKADADHDVIVIKEADLAIRFKNKTYVPVQVFINDPSKAWFHKNPLRSLQIYEDHSAVSTLRPPATVIIECSDKKPSSYGVHSLFNSSIAQNKNFEEVAITLNELCKDLGLEQQTSQKVKYLKKLRWKEHGKGSVDRFHEEIYYWETVAYGYYFARLNDKEHRIQIEVQLDSLGPSIPSVDLNNRDLRYFNW